MRRWAAGLSMVIGVMVLVGAVPLLLFFIAGGPWTWSIPSWDDLYWAARQGNISRSAVLASLAAVAWVAWLDLLWSIGWEFVVNVPRLARGQTPRATPASFGSVERLARRIVLSVLAMAAVVSATSTATAAAPNLASLAATRSLPDRAVSTVESLPVPDACNQTDAPAASTKRQTPGDLQVWIVERGDTLWDIAETALGDGARVDEVIALNPGLEDVSRLIEGQHIALPAAATVPQRSNDPGRLNLGSPRGEGNLIEAASVEVHIVEPGESLWSIADDELGDPMRWSEIFDANEGRQFSDGRRFDDPDLIQPGWDLQLNRPSTAPSTEPPTQPATSQTPPTPSQPQRPPSRPIGGSATSLPPPDVSTLEDWINQLPAEEPPATPSAQWIEPNRIAEPPGPPQAGGHRTTARDLMLAVGILTLVGARRRRRLRTLRPRARLPQPSLDVREVEQGLRQHDTGGQLARLDIAIRAATMSLIERGQRVVAAAIDPDGQIRLRSESTIDIGAPWSTDNGWLALSPVVPLEQLASAARQAGAACPTLVQIGVDQAGAAIFIDLEACEAVEIEPAGGRGDEIVTAIAASLATSTMAEVCTIVTVGIDPHATFDHPGAVSLDDAEEAIDRAVAAVGTTVRADVSTFELRGRGTSGEAWEPAVVLVSSASPPVRLPSERRGLAVVSAAPLMGPSQRLAPDPAHAGMWRLAPLGLVLDPVGLDGGRLDQFAALVDSVEPKSAASVRPEPLADVPTDDDGEPGDAAPLDSWLADDHIESDFDDDATWYPKTDDDCSRLGGEEAASGPDESTLLASQPDGPEPDTVVNSPVFDDQPTFVVRLFGGADVVGPDGVIVDFKRSKSQELVVWLSLHRGRRSTRVGARTALWSDNVRDATFANVVSDARRTLARVAAPPDDVEWIARTLTEALPLHELVATDADIVSAALDRAAEQPAEVAIEFLRPAVDLIGGFPFAGTTYLWPDAEGLTSHLVILATSATCELAGHYLSLGNTRGVFEATARGLSVLPAHEELIALRMRAHAMVGDLAGVRVEWDSYERAINADSWSDGEPSPKLVSLRHELLSSSAA